MTSQKNTAWFSFAEIIITISIIVLFAVVSANFYSGTKEKSLNSQNKVHVDALTNSIMTYTLQNKSQNLILPSWNRKFYTESSTFSDNWEDGETFWVSWFITNETYPNKDLWDVPVDPRTQQNFWYGIVKNSQEFEIAAVIWEAWNPISYVNWNYWAEDAVENLIKEYAGPNFVSSYSNEFLPYNPDEHKLIAKISDYSWNIEIFRNNEKLNFANAQEILDFVFLEWDTIKVPQSDYAQIYFSDWSESYLGSKTQDSDLTLAKLSYKKESTVFTNIQLALKIWTIWTKAPKLGENSEFQIFSQDTTASVRWTIFWVTADVNNTEILVKSWRVEVKKYVNNPSFENIISDISNEKIIEQKKIESPYVNENSEIIVVWENEWTWISIQQWQTEQTELKTDTVPEVIQSHISHNSSPLSNNILPKILEYKFNDEKIYIELELHESFKYSADILKIDNQIFLNNQWKDQETLIIDENTYFQKIDSQEKIKFIDYIKSKNSRELEISFWKTNTLGIQKQSKSLIIVLEKIEYSWTEMVEVDIIEEFIEIEDEDDTDLEVESNQEETDDSDNQQNQDNSNKWKLYAIWDYNHKEYFSIINADGDKKLRESNRSIIANCKFLNFLKIWGRQCKKKASELWAIKYSNHHSFASFANGEKGVYIDNSKSEDFIKYKTDSKIKTSENIKVSISVLWKDLNRKSGQYSLYSNKNEYIQLDNGKLIYISKIDWKSSEKLVGTLEVSNMKLKNNEFYSVVLEKNWKNVVLKVSWDNLHALGWNWYQISWIVQHSQVSNYFYVWWLSPYNFFHNDHKQWDWVINSIKFYIKD